MPKILAILLLTAALSFTTFAQKNQGKELRDAVDRVNEASKVMNSVMGITEKSIPRDLLQKAKAIVVFPEKC